MVSASQQVVRAEIAKKKATDSAERNTMLAKGHATLLVTLLESW